MTEFQMTTKGKIEYETYNSTMITIMSIMTALSRYGRSRKPSSGYQITTATNWRNGDAKKV